MWKIKIHKLVVNEDLKGINRHDRSIILKTIYKKLGTEPEKYGDQLHGGLKEYRKLKISHYRVIYKVEKKTVVVYVLKVGMRKEEQVYEEMYKRIKEL